MKLLQITFLSLFLFLFFTGKAHAYLDPGSGSYLIQFILAGLVGGLFTVKTFWLQIKTFVTNLFSRKKDKTKPATKNTNGK